MYDDLFRVLSFRYVLWFLLLTDRFLRHHENIEARRWRAQCFVRCLSLQQWITRVSHMFLEVPRNLSPFMQWTDSIGFRFQNPKKLKNWGVKSSGRVRIARNLCANLRDVRNFVVIFCLCMKASTLSEILRMGWGRRTRILRRRSFTYTMMFSENRLLFQFFFISSSDFARAPFSAQFRPLFHLQGLFVRRSLWGWSRRLGGVGVWGSKMRKID